MAAAPRTNKGFAFAWRKYYYAVTLLPQMPRSSSFHVVIQGL